LNHQLDLTEGEVERLVLNRQYIRLAQLVERLVVKAEKLPILAQKGAVAAFVPIDLNSATARDIVDVLGLPKDVAQKIVSLRPFERLEQLIEKNLVQKEFLKKLVDRGAVLKLRGLADGRMDLNSADKSEFVGLGIESEKAELIARARPFLTWSELEEFLPCDEVTWTTLRNNFRLGLKPA
jgi:DNA uptake protein ComE-like DNA-binding protein